MRLLGQLPPLNALVDRLERDRLGHFAGPFGFILAIVCAFCSVASVVAA